MANEYTPSIRLYVTDGLATGATICLDADQSHYLITVMRQKQGGVVELFNGRDGSFLPVLRLPTKKLHGLSAPNSIAASIMALICG